MSLSSVAGSLACGQAHGFHVHEASDCSGDGMATKGHFNPFGVAHGKHGDHVHHAGDLPSLKADASGVAEFKAEIKQLRVSPGPASVVGRGLIVHRDPDDYKTQPNGNAGPRPGCAASDPPPEALEVQASRASAGPPPTTATSQAPTPGIVRTGSHWLALARTARCLPLTGSEALAQVLPRATWCRAQPRPLRCRKHHRSTLR